jgi:predicted kinase
VARTDGQARSADERDVPNGRGGPDQLRVTSTTADHPHPWSREDLQQRLERLPRGHPSSPYNADGSRKPPPPELRALELPASTDDTPEPVTPLTDAEHTEHVAQVRDRLAEARDNGLATDNKHLLDAQRQVWSPERAKIHKEVVNYLYETAADAPCEHKAIMAGGLAGAGKTTVLDEHQRNDRSQYLTINPDDVKKQLAERELIPEVEGLSPMEASDLVHEESSHVAKLLAERALRDGKNIIWDITMASKLSTARRLDDLDQAGYVTSGVFVDISVEVSTRRADERHRDGHENYRNGQGLGGRFVPSEVVTLQRDTEWGCRNRRTFEEVKDRFASWAVYDNSVDGRGPKIVASGERRQDSRRESESHIPPQ